MACEIERKNFQGSESGNGSSRSIPLKSPLMFFLHSVVNRMVRTLSFSMRNYGFCFGL